MFKVALEQNDTRGQKAVEHDAQPLRHRSAIKTHDEQLTDLLAKFLVFLGSHENR